MIPGRHLTPKAGLQVLGLVTSCYLSRSNWFSLAETSGRSFSVQPHQLVTLAPVVHGYLVFYPGNKAGLSAKCSLSLSLSPLNVIVSVQGVRASVLEDVCLEGATLATWPSYIYCLLTMAILPVLKPNQMENDTGEHGTAASFVTLESTPLF